MRSRVDPLAGAVAPGMLSRSERDLRQAFLADIDRIPGAGRLQQCIQCGICTASCPVSFAMDLTPRQVIAMFRAGAIEDVLESRTIWLCASCYQCTMRCPADIRITELLYAFKRLAIGRGMFPPKFPVHVFAETFAEMVNRYGRNYEVGLILRYFIRTHPLGLIRRRRDGFALWRHGRLPIRPTRIKAIGDFRKIIAKAETFDLPQEQVGREKVTDTVGYAAIGR
ncbi:MAG TPA: 4Fe-4S dicluster domain-containing protein [Acidimicrobiia bacterium]|nr:4Fe-4S dicluster domain-containing protein [Acidimicrobiia bacterium]